VPEGKDNADLTGIDALVAVVHDEVRGDTGKSAVLRRLDPEDHVGVPALHAVLFKAGVHPLALEEEEGLLRYATCVRITALLQRVEGQPVHPGKAFAEMELSEQRLARLSAAKDQGLRDLITSIVRRAVSAGVKIAPKDLCLMILGDAPERTDGELSYARQAAEAARRRILQEYYRAKDAKDRKDAA